MTTEQSTIPPAVERVARRLARQSAYHERNWLRFAGDAQGLIDTLLEDVDLARDLHASDIASQVYPWQSLDLATKAGYVRQAQRFRACILGGNR